MTARPARKATFAICGLRVEGKDTGVNGSDAESKQCGISRSASTDLKQDPASIGVAMYPTRQRGWPIGAANGNATAQTTGAFGSPSRVFAQL